MAYPRPSNILLRLLPARAFAALKPRLEPVDLRVKQVVIAPDELVTDIYFPENAVISIVAVLARRGGIEIGMVGREGMTALATQPGDTSPFRWIVQQQGGAWRLAAADFRQALEECPDLLEIFLRFNEASAIQFAYTALTHGSFSVSQRLARWLLMAHDRAGRDTMLLVHEFIAAMLAVRRSGVTTAIHELEGAGALRAGRGMVTILDRRILAERAGGSYGVAEAEYRRLLLQAGPASLALEAWPQGK